MTRKTLIATATAIFAAGSFATAAHAACKGQGWTETTDVISCTKQGGKVVQ